MSTVLRISFAFVVYSCIAIYLFTSSSSFLVVITASHCGWGTYGIPAMRHAWLNKPRNNTRNNIQKWYWNLQGLILYNHTLPHVNDESFQYFLNIIK
jgi:hypothetical protein